MYVIIRDFYDNQLHSIHVSEMSYNTETHCMWISSHNSNNRNIPISEENFEIIMKELFRIGRLDLSNTNLRAYYDDDDLFYEDDYYE